MGILFDCLRDFGQGKTQNGFYSQGGRFKVWNSGSGKSRAYASIHIMKIRMLVIYAIFANLLYASVFAYAEKPLPYKPLKAYILDSHWGCLCEAFLLAITICNFG